MKRLDASTFTIETKKVGSKFHSMARMIISEDGNIMTVTGKGTDEEGKPTSSTFVYIKQ